MVDDVRRVGDSVDVVCFVVGNSGVIGSPACFYSDSYVIYKVPPRLRGRSRVPVPSRALHFVNQNVNKCSAIILCLTLVNPWNVTCVRDCYLNVSLLKLCCFNCVLAL